VRAAAAAPPFLKGMKKRRERDVKQKRRTTDDDDDDDGKKDDVDAPVARFLQVLELGSWRACGEVRARLGTRGGATRIRNKQAEKRGQRVGEKTRAGKKMEVRRGEEIARLDFFRISSKNFADLSIFSSFHLLRAHKLNERCSPALDSNRCMSPKPRRSRSREASEQERAKGGREGKADDDDDGIDLDAKAGVAALLKPDAEALAAVCNSGDDDDDDDDEDEQDLDTGDVTIREGERRRRGTREERGG